MIGERLILISIVGERGEVGLPAAGSVGVELGGIDEVDVVLFLFVTD